MGLFDFLFGSNESSSDPKTRVTYSEDKVTVRNSDVIYDRETGKHDTVYSKTTVDLKTGDSKYEEGAHGPNYQK